VEIEPGDRVRIATSHWKPRFVANGIDVNDFERVQAATSDWADWAPNWKAVGDAHRALAEEAAAHGRTVTATEAFQRAAWSYHLGKFLWFEDLQLHLTLSALVRTTYTDALPNLDPPGERIEIPFEGTTIPGILRLPHGIARPPIFSATGWNVSPSCTRRGTPALTVQKRRACPINFSRSTHDALLTAALCFLLSPGG